MNTQINTKYRVLTLTTGEPEDCWTIDGEPERFASREEAQRAIAEHCKDSQDACDEGHMTEPYYPAEFAIQKLQES